MGGPANDGAIYVGVLPDFQGFDAKLREQARRSGLKFGDQFASTFDAALGPQMSKDVRKAVTRATQAAPKVQVGVAVDTAAAQTKIQHLASQKLVVTAKVEADTKRAEAEILALTRQQAKLQVKVDANDAEAKAKVDALESRKVEIQAKIDADAAGAIAKVAELDARIHDLDNRRVRVDADTSGADGSIRGLITTTDRAIGSAGGLAGALAAIGPAAIPALAAATAGAVALGAAIGGAATVSLGTGLLAFSGLGDAVKALNDQESGATRAAAQASNATSQLAAKHLAAAGAADQLRQANAGLVNAQANAAESARAAAQRVRDAEDDLRSSQERARQAQLDLTDARRAAALELEDLNDRLRDSALSEEEATLRVVQAKERLLKVSGDSKASETDRKEAELALQRAELTAEEQVKQTRRLKDEKAKADRAGIEGSDRVLDARNAITEANRTVQASEQQLSEARHQQAETARRNAYSVAQAQQSIVSAQRSIQSSALSMQRVAVPAVDKVADAMRNLSPAGRDFAKFLFGLKPGLDDLRTAAATGLFPGLEDAIRSLSPLMPVLKGGIKDVAGAMADASKEFAGALLSPAVRAFLDSLFKTAPDSIRQLGILTGKVTRALATIFDQATPAGKTLLADVVTGLDRFLDRISTPEGKQQLAHFFAAGVQIVESLGGLLGGVLDLFGALAGAGGTGPASGIDAITHALHGLAGVIREHDGSGKVIAAIAGGFVALKVIGTILGPIVSLVRLIGGLGEVLGIGAAAGGGGAIAGALGGIGSALAAIGPIGWAIIAVVAALTAAFVVAYTHSETFRDIVTKAIHAVGDAFQWVWTHLIHPVIRFLRVELDVAWAVMQVVFGLIQVGLKLLGRAWMALYDDYIKPWWVKHVRPLLNEFGDWLEVHVVPKIKRAADVIGGIFGGIAAWWKSAFSDAIDNINKLLGVYNRVAKTFNVKPDNVHVDNPFSTSGARLKSTSNPSGSRGAVPLATGGHVRGPGTGTSDDIPVWLSNGEFVLRAAAVQALGLPYLDLLNRADKLGGVGGDPSQVVLGRPRYADGGLVGRTQQFIREQDPKPYVWGATGPGAWDCSGLVGAVMALLSGRDPYRRYMTTKSSMDALGFQRGHGAFTIGLDPGVHVVGNLAGLPFEAANPSAGIKVGSGAQSVDRLPQQWYLPQVGGQFVAAGGSGSGGGFDLAALAKSAFDAAVEPLTDVLGGLVGKGGAAANLGLGVARKIATDVLTFDSGGWLQPGSTLAYNGTGKPEKVLTSDQWHAVEKRQSDRPTININYPPWMPPEQALVDAHARADLLNF